eukprot:CAMPEP_0201641034 /NCGR_PEP_ID=MMETSP0493-20130528/23200_1 /ASSEMBLY_ACC=CAM_ASM_000838 /TAXON_ID=420259 /ORGANISM="Thalassiosira gravida, Strain GMp14c1" /LENGTH=244 /DNA_ID=CAMNT_0048114861 /DNA_START=14 /DNA_END=748 /DNA_ORIENTATION=-
MTGNRRGSSSDRGPMETFRYHSYFKDTISAQKRKNRVNDCEKHEVNPQLQDFLIVHHEGVIVEPEPDEYTKTVALPPPTRSILHNSDFPSRRRCEIAASEAGGRRCGISFQKVVVRDYGMVLGDHPYCSYGPPVTLGWNYVEYQPLDVNAYEYHHAQRRTLKLMVLNFYRRKEILLEEHSEGDLSSATTKVNRSKMKRAVSRKLLPCWKVFDASESAGRKLGRVVNKGSPKEKVGVVRRDSELI